VQNDTLLVNNLTLVIHLDRVRINLTIDDLLLHTLVFDDAKDIAALVINSLANVV